MMLRSKFLVFTLLICSLLTAQAAPAGSVRAANLQLVELSRYQAVGSEISAYDAATQTLIVAGAGSGLLQLIDLSDPTKPVLVRSFPMPATSVAAKNGIVAVAVPGKRIELPGRVYLIDLTKKNPVRSLPVGALPDMVTFTPDGAKVLVANEGEPSNGIDPQGSVSIIDLSAGMNAATVKQVAFNAFNSQRADLVGRGVRIFPDAASVAQDLEPEYISVSPDGLTAWVTLQEANSVAVLDIVAGVITRIIPLGLKDFSRGLPSLANYQWNGLPLLGVTAPSPTYPSGQQIFLGGFSGLFFEGYAPNGNLRFITHPDRGPNGEPTSVPGIGTARPFPLPDFQPELVRFEFNPSSGEFSILERIGLTRPDGVTPLTGLPNLRAQASGLSYTDEIPVDLFGNVLPFDILGGDLEGIVVALDGSFWMVDEYRPAIYHFSPAGVLLDRFTPQGTAAIAGQPAGTYGTEALPAVYAQRRANRGFEAVALEGNRLYAFIQSPIDNPDSTNDAVSRASRVTRILEFDATTHVVTAEYLYILDNISGSGVARTDKIGDAVSLGNGRFLVAERDDRTGSDANKLLFEIDLKAATNVNDPANLTGVPAATTLEQLKPDELAAAGVQPVYKQKWVNLAPLGYTGVSKLEGLAMIDADTFAVLNDNDFGIEGVPIALDGTVPLNPDPEPVQLGLLRFDRPNGLDASDRDSSINIRRWPVLGMFMPDGISSFDAGGTYYITANEGDARDEEARMRDLSLDPVAFPDASTLRSNANLGRLNVSSINGDLDGDGLYERLFTLGGRSFTIWDSAGNRVFDSGDELEQITAALTPSLFNADDGDPAEFDTRSDNKGPEAESVTVGEVGGVTYAFVGLERAGGGVLVYDLTDPTAPAFVSYTRSDADISPEGLLFIPASESPNGAPLLVLSHEVSNTVTVYMLVP